MQQRKSLTLSRPSSAPNRERERERDRERQSLPASARSQSRSNSQTRSPHKPADSSPAPAPGRQIVAKKRDPYSLQSDSSDDSLREMLRRRDDIVNASPTTAGPAAMAEAGASDLWETVLQLNQKVQSQQSAFEEMQSQFLSLSAASELREFAYSAAMAEIKALRTQLENADSAKREIEYKERDRDAVEREKEIEALLGQLERERETTAALREQLLQSESTKSRERDKERVRARESERETERQRESDEREKAREREVWRERETAYTERIDFLSKAVQELTRLCHRLFAATGQTNPIGKTYSNPIGLSEELEDGLSDSHTQTHNQQFNPNRAVYSYGAAMEDSLQSLSQTQLHAQTYAQQQYYPVTYSQMYAQSPVYPTMTPAYSQNQSRAEWYTGVPNQPQHSQDYYTAQSGQYQPAPPGSPRAPPPAESPPVRTRPLPVSRETERESLQFQQLHAQTHSDPLYLFTDKLTHNNNGTHAQSNDREREREKESEVVPVRSPLRLAERDDVRRTVSLSKPDRGGSEESKARPSSRSSTPRDRSPRLSAQGSVVVPRSPSQDEAVPPALNPFLTFSAARPRSASAAATVAHATAALLEEQVRPPSSARPSSSQGPVTPGRRHRNQMVILATKKPSTSLTANTTSCRSKYTYTD